MRLSVISAFARLDLDPWQEAANLAQLPKATATRRLAALITKLPGLPFTQRDIATAASRLIAHLPRLASSPVSATKTLLGAGVSPHTAIRAYPLLYVWMILAVFVLGGLSIAASHQLTAGHVVTTSPPTTGTDIPQTPPPTAGR